MLECSWAQFCWKNDSDTKTIVSDKLKHAWAGIIVTLEIKVFGWNCFLSQNMPLIQEEEMKRIDSENT